MRAASGDALRWLDLGRFQTSTIMSDQVLVPEDDSVTVVLDNDFADLVDGLPTRIHLEALDVDLQLGHAHAPRPLQFLGTAHPAKPRYLKLIERWVRDGMRATPRSSVPPLRE